MKPISWRTEYRKESTFLPAGCIHWPIGEKDLLRQWVKELKTTPGAFGLLMGDSFDLARTHYRDHLRTYRTDNNSQIALDDMVRREVRDLAKVLEPVAHRIIGTILGNHFFTFSDETNSEQYLCQLLGIPYLGPVGIVRVDFVLDDHVEDSVTIYAHHHGGSGGGRTTGGDVAALERSELVFESDVYVLGHTHRRFAFKIPKMSVTRKGRPRVTEQNKLMIRAGAFLKGFKEDSPSTSQPHYPTYAESKALRPTDLGYVRAKIILSKDPDGIRKRSYEVTY